MKLYNPLQMLVIVVVALMVVVRTRELPTFEENAIGYLTKDGRFGCGVKVDGWHAFLIQDNRQANARPKRGLSEWQKARAAISITSRGIDIVKEMVEDDAQ